MSYNMLDMELDYQEQIEYLESEVKRLKAKCNRLIRENRELKGEKMLINLSNNETNHVKFISYTGKWPNLCRGLLTLNIDGKDVTFGYSYLSKPKPDYEPFWYSGGGLMEDYMGAYTGEWQIDVERIPEQFRKYATEIDEVFNVNVEHGCCGGCI